MLSTDIDSLTPAQRAKNEAACNELVPGATYAFLPPVVTTAVPADKSPVVHEVCFSVGWYLGFVRGNHVFQGRPDSSCAGPDLRECFFHVAFVGGSGCIRIGERPEE